MVTIRIAKQIIRQLVSELQSVGYSPTRAILFGSIAKEKSHPLSDIDVAIWDKKFTGCRPIDIEPLIKILHRYSRVELHTFGASEGASDNPFIQEVERDGIVVDIKD